MKTYPLANTGLHVTRLGYGCMQLGGAWDDRPLTDEARARAVRVIGSALEHGIRFFDHADIYCRGKSETAFGEALRNLGIRRADVVIQSKCGIRFADDPRPGDPGRYDFSYDHIVRAVEGSLRRLQCEYLDILLLHRPDPLVVPVEVARAFDELERSGQVRHFGVSNHTPAQMALLQKFVRQPLVVNQLELNLLHADLIDDAVFANTPPRSYTGVGGTLDTCRAAGMLVQAWAPVANGLLFQPPADSPERVRRAAGLVAHLAQARGMPPEAIALAWLLRHPAPIQPIIGTTNPDRIAASCRADDVELTREEWYSLAQAARGQAVP